MAKAIHRVKHWLGWEPCEFVQIIHEPGCTIHCIAIKGNCCKWRAELRCKECGELRTL